jgi:hypothetical protein
MAKEAEFNLKAQELERKVTKDQRDFALDLAEFQEKTDGKETEVLIVSNEEM